MVAARALIVKADVRDADALVVLSGSADYVERARAAAALLHAGRAKKIILTNDGRRGGWSNEEQRNLFFFERAMHQLKNAHVSETSIEVLPAVVESTHDEAVVVRQHCVNELWRRILVVTSPYHSRRALWTFRRELGKSGIEVGVTFPNEAQSAVSPSPWLWWLTPRGWRMVAGEYVKFAYYRISFH